jgi:hypothetical protein
VLTWDEATPNTTFNVYRGTSSGSESPTPLNGSTPILLMTYTDTNVAAGQEYFYRVQAVQAGVTAMSDEVPANIPSP